MAYLQPILTRERTIKSIRNFFYQLNFHEIITPVLNNAIPNEPNLYSFITRWKTNRGEQTFFLPMSPERSLKLSLAKGIDNCFSIGHSFRNLEQESPLHSPEFLMLEWYRTDADYHQIMDDVKELIKFLNYESCRQAGRLRITNLPDSWPIFSLPELFKKYTKHDLIKLTNDETKRSDYDKIFCNEIESRLPKEPFFITDFPASISPLCRPKKDNPLLAERFEFYINGIELGNGNTENTDWKSVKKVFESQKKKNNYPVDEDFLNALKTLDESGKTYAGVGIGIDRLTAILGGANHIKLV